MLQKQQEEPERDEDYLFLKHVLSHDYPKVQVECVHELKIAVYVCMLILFGMIISGNAVGTDHVYVIVIN